jgi:SpoVK/Ycf46/Vps4 family AAA+-type ATPase
MKKEGRIGRWAKTTNMSLALDTMLAAINAADGVPRMCLFYGPSGFGKTIACSHVAAITDAAYLQASSVWTGKTFLEKLAAEIGITHLGSTASKILDQISGAFAQRSCPLIIDEMDYLVGKKSVELIRDIYEATGIPIMMIGEEAMPAKLKEWECFDNRILKATAAQPATLEDGQLLRDLYVRDSFMLADDLVDYFTTECDGVTRRIVVNLQEAQRVAIDELGTTKIDRDAWGNRPVMNGSIQMRRRG